MKENSKQIRLNPELKSDNLRAGILIKRVPAFFSTCPFSADNKMVSYVKNLPLELLGMLDVCQTFFTFSPYYKIIKQA